MGVLTIVLLPLCFWKCFCVSFTSPLFELKVRGFLQMNFRVLLECVKRKNKIELISLAENFIQTVFNWDFCASNVPISWWNVWLNIPYKRRLWFSVQWNSKSKAFSSAETKPHACSFLSLKIGNLFSIEAQVKTNFQNQCNLLLFDMQTRTETEFFPMWADHRFHWVIFAQKSLCIKTNKKFISCQRK